MKQKTPLIIVGSKTCTNCKMLKNEVENFYYNDYDMKYYDMEDMPSNLLNEFFSTGIKKVPAIKINDKWHSGIVTQLSVLLKNTATKVYA